MVGPTLACTTQSWLLQKNHQIALGLKHSMYFNGV
jgi:hypothetical protein